MAVRNIQMIHIRPTTLLLQRHYNVHEAKTKLFLCQRRGTTNHHKLNDDLRIRIPRQTPKKKQASEEPSEPCLPDTVTRVQHNPQKRVGSEPTSELAGGKIDPGCLKGKI